MFVVNCISDVILNNILNNLISTPFTRKVADSEEHDSEDELKRGRMVIYCLMHCLFEPVFYS